MREENGARELWLARFFISGINGMYGIFAECICRGRDSVERVRVIKLHKNLFRLKF